MELIRISDRKMKIMLTPTDMCHFELNADTFGEDITQMHRSFRLLLEEIRKQTGFDANDRQISVQYFPSREGGCEMFISRLPSSGDSSSEPSSVLPYGKTLPLKQNDLRRSGFHRECAYRFSNISALLAVCQRLCSIGYVGNSTAYRDDKEAYYLILTVFSASPFTTPDELNFIVEYGDVENVSLLKLYIREHGSVICQENAVHQLAILS
ncbi:MAG: adaptor protein MecA [Clostridia bacterium]|nr:adaptor protein MecA [Clostridia bacterium]